MWWCIDSIVKLTAKQQAKEVLEEIANVSASVKAVTTTAKAPPLKHTIEEATGPEC